jgi:hypothetical protein
METSLADSHSTKWQTGELGCCPLWRRSGITSHCGLDLIHGIEFSIFSRALRMASGKNANAAEEFPILSIHRVEGDVGTITKSICQSDCRHRSVSGQT